ncbi:MAG: response regulator, partial [Telluria sp.]
MEDLRLDATLSKPVTRDNLIATIVELHTGRAQPAQGQAKPLAGRLEGIYVLLVEDNQINQEVANYLLLHAGAAVDIAGDGQVAVDMLTAAPTRYDAVLMDIQMPVMNGYQATQAIRKMGLADLPIIAMTANVMEDDRARAIEAGMNAHISKPIDVDNMVEALVRVTSGGDAGELREPARAGYRAHASDD